MGGHKKKNKKGGHGRAKQGQAASATGSLPSTTSDSAGFMVHEGTANTAGVTLQSTSKVTGATASTSATSCDGAADAMAELRIGDQGGKHAANSKQVPMRQGNGSQARASTSASAVAQGSSKQAHAPNSASSSTRAGSSEPNRAAGSRNFGSRDFNALDLVAQLNNSRGRAAGALLRNVCTLALSKDEHMSALLGAGVLPAVLRLAQSDESIHCDTLFEAVMLFTFVPNMSFSKEEAENLIRQMVPLVRSRDVGIQCMALGWLSNLTSLDKRFCGFMGAAGVIPAVMEALHAKLVRSKIQAAFVLVETVLATVGVMGIDTALAAAIPVAVSALECEDGGYEGRLPPVHDQLTAAFLLIRWASRTEEAGTMAVKSGAVPALLPRLSSRDWLLQQAAARLLSTLLAKGVGAEAAVEAGAIPPLVRLLRNRDQHTRVYAADALQVLVKQCSQTDSIAAAAAAAGAIKPLISMLASTGPSEGQQTEHSEKASMKFYCGSLEPYTLEDQQKAALECLLSIINTGDTQRLTDMVEAGAVLELSDVNACGGSQISLLAQRVFKCLMVDDGVQQAVAVKIVSMLCVLDVQRSAMATVYDLCEDKGFRSAVLGAGAFAALVPVLSTQHTDCYATEWAAMVMKEFVAKHGHVAEAVAAGVIGPLGSLMMDGPTRRSHDAAASVLFTIGQDPTTHDQLAAVIPWLISAMQWEGYIGPSPIQYRDDTARYAGALLQKMALVGNPKAMQAFHQSGGFWLLELSTKRSKVQNYAAGAIFLQFRLLGKCAVGDCERRRFGSKEGLEAFFRSIKSIDPHAPQEQWTPLFTPERAAAAAAERCDDDWASADSVNGQGQRASADSVNGQGQRASADSASDAATLRSGEQPIRKRVWRKAKRGSTVGTSEHT